MGDWFSAINSTDPIWAGYIELLGQLKGDGFPTAADLNNLLSPDAVNAQGLPVRFVPSSQTPDVNYETHIYSTAQVSTRELSWHDLFNALVWARYPRIKSAINALHFQ